MGDNITLEVYLSKMSADGTKWSFEHRFMNDAGKLMATLHVDGSWIDIVARKLYKDIPQDLLQSFIDFPRTDNFEMLS